MKYCDFQPNLPLWWSHVSFPVNLVNLLFETQSFIAVVPNQVLLLRNREFIKNRDKKNTHIHLLLFFWLLCTVWRDFINTEETTMHSFHNTYTPLYHCYNFFYACRRSICFHLIETQLHCTHYLHSTCDRLSSCCFVQYSIHTSFFW